MLIANFSNPQGSLMPEANKRRILALLASKNVALIEDDTYGDLGFTVPRPASCFALAPQADIFYCGTFSKTISPDLRLGWVIAPKHTAKLEYLKFISKKVRRNAQILDLPKGKGWFFENRIDLAYLSSN